MQRLYLLSRQKKEFMDSFFLYVLKKEGFSVASHLMFRGDEMFYYSSNPDWEKYYTSGEFYKKCLVLEDLKKSDQDKTILYSMHPNYLKDPVAQDRFLCCEISNGLTLFKKKSHIKCFLFLGWSQKLLLNENVLEKFEVLRYAQQFFENFHFMHK